MIVSDFINTCSGHESSYGEKADGWGKQQRYDELHQVVNEKKQVLRIEYYMNGARVLTNSGVSAVEREYDENGTVTEERRYGIDDEPIEDQT